MNRITALIVALLMSSAAHAQQREFYDTRTGKSIGRATTDSGGATTIYGADGRVTGRATTGSNGTTTLYDANGSRVGTITKDKR